MLCPNMLPLKVSMVRFVPEVEIPRLKLLPLLKPVPLTWIADVSVLDE